MNSVNQLRNAGIFDGLNKPDQNILENLIEGLEEASRTSTADEALRNTLYTVAAGVLLLNQRIRDLECLLATGSVNG